MFRARYIQTMHQCAIPPYSQFTLIVLPFLLCLFPLSPVVLSLDLDDLRGPCRDYCDKRRPKEVHDVFKFNCNEVYATDSERDACQKSCETCPKEVCDETLDANRWTCPGKHVPQACTDFCNSKRPKGNRMSYTLYCYNYDSFTDCKAECSKCPSFICDPGNPQVFNCLTENFVGPCLDECKEERYEDDEDVFIFKCSEKYRYSWMEDSKNQCQETCQNHCPPYVCERGTDKYVCPPLYPESDLMAKPSYKGACKEKCDASQGGGLLDFDLNCHERYTTDKEKQRCLSLCAECSTEVCPSDRYGESSGVIKCRGDPIEVEKEKRKQEEVQERRKKEDEVEEKLDQEAREDGDNKEKEDKSRKGAFLVTFIVMTLILILVAIFGCCCCLKQSGDKETEPVHLTLGQEQAVRQATLMQMSPQNYAMGQQQQQLQFPLISQTRQFEMQPPLETHMA